MKKGKRLFGKLNKIVISIVCIITLVFSVPIKAKADVIESAIDLLLRIPDAVMWLGNIFLADRDTSDSMMSIDLKGVHAIKDDEGYLYNFFITPYDIFTCGEVRYYNDQYGNEKLFRNLPIFYANFFNIDDGITADNDSYALKSNEELRPAISNVYKSLRNLALILMMIVLLYIGIRIILSTVASDKAKYKNMLFDWLVGLSLLFLMQYIMSFIMNINDIVVDMLENGESATYYIAFGQLGGSPYAEWGSGEEWYEQFDDYPDDTFIDLHLDIPGHAKSNGKWQGISDDKNSTKGFPLNKSDGTTTYSLKEWNGTLTVDDHTDWGDNGTVRINAYIDGTDDNEFVCIYRANLIEYIRTISTFSQTFVRIYSNNNNKSNTITDSESDDTDESSIMARMSYAIVYIALVLETIMFAFIYFKRVFQLAFYTMIAPIVAIMYPIDKIGDGKAQAFNTWFKDYLFNVLIQPMHLLLYTVFITATMDLFNKNIIYAAAIYGFMIPAEKYFKKLLGFDKASSGGGGGLAGALGAGAAMNGLKNLVGHGPSGPRGSSGGGKGGAGGGKGGSTDSSKIKTHARNREKEKNKVPKSDGSSDPLSSGGSFKDRLKNGAKNAGNAVLNMGKARASSAGRKISKAITGNKYDNLSGSKKQYAKAVGKNLLNQGKKALTGTRRFAVNAAGKAAGAVAYGGLGLMAGAATAIATGDFKNLTAGVAIGASAGLKYGGNIGRSINVGLDSWADDAKAYRAEHDESYNNQIRIENQMAQFDASDLDKNGRRDTIERLGADDIDFNGNTDTVDLATNRLDELESQGYSASEAEEQVIKEIKDAEDWPDLRSKSNKESYIAFEANERLKDMNDNVVSDADVAQRAKANKQKKIDEINEREEKMRAEYDEKISKAHEAMNAATDASSKKVQEDRKKKLERQRDQQSRAFEKERNDAIKGKIDDDAKAAAREELKEELARKQAEESLSTITKFQKKIKPSK